MRSSLLAIALLIAIIGDVAEAQSYARSRGRNIDGEQVFCISWSKRNLVYRVDSAGSARTPGDGEYAAINASFDTWKRLSESCSDFKIAEGKRITNPSVGLETDADNVLTFREQTCKEVVPADDPCVAELSCRQKYGCWEGSVGTIALASVNYSKLTGVIRSADIEFNAAQYLFTTVTGQPCPEEQPSETCVAYDLQNVATHEIGHFFGFEHVTTSAASTMSPTAILGDVQKRGFL
jgi:Matrixin